MNTESKVTTGATEITGATATTHDIELPPLPEARIVSYQTDSTMRRMELRTHSDEDMRDYARAAIEADRKRRGEPVAWRYLTPTGWHATTDAARALGAAEHHTVEPLFAAPQPAEPSKGETVLYTSQEALDLISRSDAVVSVGLTRVPQMSWNVPLYTVPQPAEPVHETARAAGNGAGSGMNTGSQAGAHDVIPYSGCGCGSEDCRVNGCLSRRQTKSAMATSGGGMPTEPVYDETADVMEHYARHNPPAEPGNHSIQDCPEVDKWNCKYCKRVNSCPVQGHRDAQPVEPVGGSEC